MCTRILAPMDLKSLEQARSFDSIGPPDTTFPQPAYSGMHIGSQDIEEITARSWRSTTVITHPPTPLVGGHLEERTGGKFLLLRDSGHESTYG